MQKTFPLFVFSLVSIGDADADDFLENVDEVMRCDIVSEPLALFAKVHRGEVVGDLGKVLATACSPGLLESKELEGDEPDEGTQVGDDHIRPHQLEHILLTLEVVHEH